MDAHNYFVLSYLMFPTQSDPTIFQQLRISLVPLLLCKKSNNKAYLTNNKKYDTITVSTKREIFNLEEKVGPGKYDTFIG